MAKVRKVNYSPAQTLELVEAFSKADTTEKREAVKVEFADKFGKSKRSITAKLSRELGEAYPREGYKAKADGDTARRKTEIAEGIATLLEIPKSAVKGLDKASKTALLNIQNAISR